MPKSKNSYSKGLNQDTSRSKYDPTNYYDALNLKIVTHGGLSTGSIENEKGNAATFSIPNVPGETITHPDGTQSIIPDQNDLKIIGWCSVNKYIILFTTNEINENPANSAGQIWQLEYVESSNQIKDISGGSLTVTDHLIYNGFLNFSTYNRIETEGRFENDITVRVYWTDFYNSLRSINLFDPKLRITKPDVLASNPNITFSMPFPIAVGNGSLTPGIKVQYAYRLKSESGAQSFVSPASPIITLPKVIPLGETEYLDMYGDTPVGASGTRSVTFRVQDIDTDYDIIEHIAVIYNEAAAGIDTFEMYIFDEDVVPDDGQMDVLLTGTETKTSITNVDFNKTGSSFDKCKTIDAKNNYLIAGNIILDPSEIPTDTWDARAYRFNKFQKAKLNDEDTFIELDASGGATPDWDSVPSDHDAINIYNKEREDNVWNLDENQYMFQENGTTEGGSGKNVSYTFTRYRVDLNSNRPTQARNPPWYSVDKISKTHESGVYRPIGDKVEYLINDQFNNFSSPIIEAFFTGYARGEVYRFGIQFYTKKGHVTFVNWIGDIKFPDEKTVIGDGQHMPTGTMDATLSGFSYGIKFNIDVSAIAGIISGYRIVRAKREEKDVTRLGSGVIMLFDRHLRTDDQHRRQSLYQSVAPSWFAAGASSSVETGIRHVRWDGDKSDKRYHLPDLPGLNISGKSACHRRDSGGFSVRLGGETASAGVRQHTILFSPLVTAGLRDVLNFEFKPGDYLKTVGYYRANAYSYRTGILGGDGTGHDYKWSGVTDDTDVDDRQSRQAWMWFCRNWKARKHEPEAFPIKDVNYLDNAVRLSGQDALETIDDQGCDFLNVSYGRADGIYQDKHPFGIGTDIAHVKLYPFYWPTFLAFPDSPGFKAAEFMDWDDNVREGEWNGYEDNGINITGRNGNIDDHPFWWMPHTDGSQDWKFKEVVYVRPTDKQYGGDTHEDRSKTRYISTGHYQPISASVPTNIEFDVFGGDVTVSLFDKEYIQEYKSESIQNPEGSAGLDSVNDLRLNVGVSFPCENRINIEMASSDTIRFSTNRRGGEWYTGTTGESTGAHISDNWNHQVCYMQNPIVEAKFVAKDFATTVLDHFPHRLWHSQEKTDGELTDSWRDFRITDILDVDGSYGPINKVINFQDRVVFYQDRAIGITSIEERALTTDGVGAELALGTGRVMKDFRYMTTTTGSVHQHAVVASTSALYHYDVRLRRVFKLTQSAQPLSDIKGMSSFFANNVDNDIVNTDITLRDSTLGGAIGVHGGFDSRHNRIFFTFLSPKPGKNDFTIGYNESIDAFESFYSYTPQMYLDTGRRLLSPATNLYGTGQTDTSDIYLHDAGEYGSFYGEIANTEITLIVSPVADVPKIFTNIEYNSEVSIDDVQQFDQTLSSFEIWNDYQTTGVIPLIVGTNIKRRIRHWRHVIGRASDSSTQRARIRDYAIYLKLTHSNTGNKRLVLHDIIVSYTPARD